MVGLVPSPVQDLSFRQAWAFLPGGWASAGVGVGVGVGGAAQMQERSDSYSRSPRLLKDGRIRLTQGHWPLGQHFRVHLTPSPVLYTGLQVPEKMFFSSAPKD